MGRGVRGWAFEPDYQVAHRRPCGYAKFCSARCKRPVARRDFRPWSEAALEQKRQRPHATMMSRRWNTLDHQKALDRPVVAGAVATTATGVFVLCRLAVVGRWQIARFVMAERQFVNPKAAPAGLPVLRRNGYDGQFYYRLALNPANLHRVAYGMTLDAGFRLQRIGYPVLAWLVAAGQKSWIPTTLVIVNVAAVGALGWLGALAARQAGHHALWGLLLAGYFGFVFSVARDTAEPVAAAFMVGGFLAYRSRRFGLAALLLAAGALSRETVLVAAAAIAITRVVTMFHQRKGPERADLAWVVPPAVFAGWQLVVHHVDGLWPMSSDAHDNLTEPFQGLIDGLRSHLSVVFAGPFSSHAAPDDSWVLEVIVLAVVLGLALASLPRTSAPVQERVALVLFTLDLCVLSADIWNGVVDLRSLDEVYVLAILMLLGLPARWRRLGLAAGRGRLGLARTDRLLALVAVLTVLMLAIVVAHRIIDL